MDLLCSYHVYSSHGPGFSDADDEEEENEQGFSIAVDLGCFFMLILLEHCLRICFRYSGTSVEALPAPENPDLLESDGQIAECPLV